MTTAGGDVQIIFVTIAAAFSLFSSEDLTWLTNSLIRWDSDRALHFHPDEGKSLPIRESSQFSLRVTISNDLKVIITAYTALTT